MNWSKAVTAGAAGGVVLAVYEFIMHGVIMGNTYRSMPNVFRQDTNPMWFPVVAIVMSITAALLFARSRSAWGAGAKGGMTFGFFLGLVAFASMFYTPLVQVGFPYYLTWCWGSISLIGWVIFGAVAGSLYK